MDVFWIIFLFLLGACIGSFLNVVIHRVPRGESISFPGSHCPKCGKSIAWYDNIPIVSWLVLRGRCRQCGVGISPRYLVIELITALLVSGLYVCYWVLELRPATGTFEQNWPIMISHGLLLCALLACSVVDIEIWEVLPEACWVAALVGAFVATVHPVTGGQVPVLAPVGPTLAAMAAAAGVGVVLASVLQRFGWIQPSFLDAENPARMREDEPIAAPEEADNADPAVRRKRRRKRESKPADEQREESKAVAFTSESGVNPRLEMFRELAFLAPALLLAGGTWALLHWMPGTREAWSEWYDGPSWMAPHAGGLAASLAGFLIGGGWIWGIRIVGTLAFGKEAMGLGDVHILAAVGAVTGWVVPTIAFFVAPFFGLLWALYLLVGRNQRELPYGPWLAAASVVVMVFLNPISDWISAYTALL
jgi:leader peptidase (prepilin peptidase)/N-methyltransferase